MDKQLLIDGAERVGVTAGLAGVSTALVVIADWPYVWVPVLAAVLNVLKVLLASRVGSPDSGGFYDGAAREPVEDAAAADEAVVVDGEAPEGFEGWDDTEPVPETE